MKINTENDDLFFSKTYEFLEIYLPKQRGKSQCTIKSYRDTLTQFRGFLLEEKKISILKFSFIQCNRQIVMDFLDYISSRGCSNSTRNQRLSAINSYLAFVAEKDISLQPIALIVKKIKSASAIEPLRICMSPETITAILSQPNTNSSVGIRDSTMMILLFDSAIRLAELLDLRIGNVSLDGDNSYIRVMGKGSKERIVSICEKAGEHYERYIKLCRDKDSPDTDLVFYTIIKGKAGKMSEKNVERFIQQYADLARETCPSVPERVHPHMFRRARATLMYQSGVALPIVSKILGHASVNTTKIYAQPSLDMLKEAVSVATYDDGSANEKPLWEKGEEEEEIARKLGLR
jgi:site-specific recombinase XerD